MIRLFYIIICAQLIVLLPAQAAEHLVKPGESIQAAINKASKGDLIKVLPGTYREKGILINKQLVLQGIGYPVLDGENKYEVVTITADHVVVQGFEIIRSGYSSMDELAAVRIKQASYVGIRNNRLRENFFGIYCQHASFSLIAHNDITSTGGSELEAGNGIHAWKSNHLVIDGNFISGHRDGIYFEFVTESTITNNKSHQNIRYGLHFMFSHQDIYTNNTFSENGAGVAVMYSRQVTMIRNHFLDNWGSAAYGILLKEISDSYAAYNEFSRNTAAIYMEGSSRLIIFANRFLQNGYGIRIQASCDNNVIRKNNFIANSFDIATNGSLVLNSFNENYWDKYEGYDLNRDGMGDIPYRPLSLFALIVERNNSAMMLFRSPMVGLLEKAEKIMPGITPEKLKDNQPSMKPFPL
ncbi:right-handed parallel beta-helix repeat-containing protein [Flavihumibacter cheonanensis]|uniref:nitrous oxide reductase family maturation protein NosD n=1 Tax=Flavihumibacter cheonanensis TaxID=1442385 RepID=UPI001EF8347C|nr:nitrous oxide reductase family maturation protein NosD [Flavihumibacter cheonanensis]MCG7752408.1 nitrous oxide reductase family maturation protein NosD [Flavihumibacter cheonanensis]